MARSASRVARFACAVACFASVLTVDPAAASGDPWPALFDVTGVATSDDLNVRAEPDADSDIVGTLAANATDIEVIHPNDDETWGLVNTAERSGWVSLAFLTRQEAVQTGMMIGVRQCFGTEPFWSLSFDPPRMTLAAPDITPREGLISGQFRSTGQRDRFAFTGSFFPTEAGNRDVTMSVRLESCGDGMSDRRYGIGIDMLITRPDRSGDWSMTGLYSGCCTLSPQP